MSFEEEWAQHKAAASAQMQLNQMDGGGGGYSSTAPANGDLKVNQKDLAAVGDAAYGIYERLGKAGAHADTETQMAGLELTGFALSGALTNLSIEWQTQLGPVLGACAHISNHLDYTKKAHAGDEEAIATSFSIASIDDGFNERTQVK